MHNRYGYLSMAVTGDYVIKITGMSQNHGGIYDIQCIYLKAYNAHTGTLIYDGDFDGISDGTEIHGYVAASGTRYYTNPLLCDSDGDELSDFAELSTH